MVTKDSIMLIRKDDIQEAAKTLSCDDISQLVEWLSLKDDNIRYQVFLLLQNRSLLFDDVYPYWDIFLGKLKNENSYQRSIGLMLIAENAKWDTMNKMDDAIDEYLDLLNDDKPILVRQCIQSLGKIALSKPGLMDKIASRLMAFRLEDVKETMRKSVLLDILDVLLLIRKEYKSGEIDSFILNALTGDLLDKKSKKQIEALLN